MRFPRLLATPVPAVTGTSRSVDDDLDGGPVTFVGIACLALLAAGIATSIAAVKVRAMEQRIDRGEDRILTTLDELNDRFAEFARNAGVADEKRIVSGLDALNGKLRDLAKSPDRVGDAKVLAALEELNGRLAQLMCAMHPGSGGSVPWPAEPLVRPRHNWEDEV